MSTQVVYAWPNKTENHRTDNRNQPKGPPNPSSAHHHPYKYLTTEIKKEVL